MLKAYEPSGGVLFEEKQKFPGWLNLLVAGIFLFTVTIILIAAFAGPQQEREKAWIGAVIAIPGELLVFVLFQYVQLEKVVTTNGVYFRWKPWQKKFRVIEKESIAGFEVRKGPQFHYGTGWAPGYGRVHNANAVQGVQFHLTSGSRLYLGSPDAGLFNSALQQLISAHPKQRLREF